MRHEGRRAVRSRLRRARRRLPRVPRAVRQLLLVAGVPAVVVAAAYVLAGSHAIVPGLDGCRYVRDVAARTGCYTDRSDSLVRRDGVQQALRRIERLAGEDHVAASSCHVALHPVGERMGRADADSDRRARPVDGGGGRCGDGFAHGYVIGYSEQLGDLEQLAAEGASLCDRSSGGEQDAGNCVHAFGHVFVRRSDGDVPRAAGLCGDIAKAVDDDAHGRLRDTCLWGVFMELAFRDVGGASKAGSSRSDHGADGAAGDHARACRSLDGRAAAVCYAFVPVRAGMFGGSARDAARACERDAPAGAPLDACIREFARSADVPGDCRLFRAAAARRTCMEAARTGSSSAGDGGLSAPAGA